jgi:beta-galactosidase
MNGANFDDESAFSPQVSSYDYDAALDEAGNPTEKYMQFRNVISKYLPAGQKLPDMPAKRRTTSIPEINLTQVSDIFDILPEPKRNSTPLTFEALNQDYGFVLYRTVISEGKSGWLKI